MAIIKTTSSNISPNCIRINSKIISINRNLPIFQNLRCITIPILPRNPVLLITKPRSTSGITTILAVWTTVTTRYFIVIEHHLRIMSKRYRPIATGISRCPTVCLRRGRCRAGGRWGIRGNPTSWIKWYKGLLCILWTSSLQGWSRLNVWRLFRSNLKLSCRMSTTGWNSSELIWLELWVRIWEVWRINWCRWSNKLSRSQKEQWGNICRWKNKNWGRICWG